MCEIFIAPSRNIRWPAITVTLGTEEGREVTAVERLKQKLMYGLSAKKEMAVVERWLLVEVFIVFTLRQWET